MTKAPLRRGFRVVWANYQDLARVWQPKGEARPCRQACAQGMLASDAREKIHTTCRLESWRSTGCCGTRAF